MRVCLQAFRCDNDDCVKQAKVGSEPTITKFAASQFDQIINKAKANTAHSRRSIGFRVAALHCGHSPQLRSWVRYEITQCEQSTFKLAGNLISTVDMYWWMDNLGSCLIRNNCPSLRKPLFSFRSIVIDPSVCRHPDEPILLLRHVDLERIY